MKIECRVGSNIRGTNEKRNASKFVNLKSNRNGEARLVFREYWKGNKRLVL